MDSWVATTEERGPAQLTLSPAGIRWRDPEGTCLADWDQVFGVVSTPERLYVLVPRRPPRPPWFEVHAEHLSGAQRVGGLDELARQIEARSSHWGYRDRPRTPRHAPDALLQLVLAREEVPGALEVPVGAGPGGWWRRGLELLGGGSAGGIAGLYAGALSGSVGLSVAGASVGALTGAAAPVLLGPNWRSVRARRRRPRVLVLAPDGCVVGLPSGPAAFDWPSLRGFSASEEESLREPERPRPCLEITGADGRVVGRIDAAWFTRPLPLIVGVAEAYRRRCLRALGRQR